ncbi:terminase small subunit [Bradyrhizobium sp. BR 10289]|uniref:terminase small subunit n=1 Tax=Bradyrhizobium sp. BR 10289 TaxID=2749993 RepID=UPI001C647F2B|nr:terminase small subunit [Bradyrhizobium sp. BR 10289]MBW7968613.1 terminase small subunit [Bradyrhizobium sp. BR 10289]
MTPKQQAFVTEYLKDRNGAQAATRAGYSAKTANVKAAALMRLPEVKEAIGIATAEVAEASKITLASCFARLETAYNIAQAKGNATAMVGAVTALAKLAGLWVEKTEDIAARDATEAQLAAAVRSSEAKKAGELLADAAESLGLSRTATPAEIVGAVSERAVAPPAVFALMHAKAKGDTIQ